MNPRQSLQSLQVKLRRYLLTNPVAQRFVRTKHKVLAFFKRLWTTLSDAPRCLYHKFLFSTLHTFHTSPRWVIGGTSPNTFYFGICRSCSKQITPRYMFLREEGPFYNVLPKDRRGNRDLHTIIQTCVKMFLSE
jgi:hypothetical protein